MINRKVKLLNLIRFRFGHANRHIADVGKRAFVFACQRKCFHSKHFSGFCRINYVFGISRCGYADQNVVFLCIAVDKLCINHNFNESEINEITSKIKVLDKETSNPQIYTDIIKSSIISELVVLLIRSSSDSADENIPQLIQQAVVYVNTNFGEKLTLGGLAKELSVSVNYLGSLFKKYLKTSFNEYLNNIRLKYACKLLLTSDLTIKEVAFESGYSSVEYFSYTFKKIMHMSPGAYHRDGF